MPAGNNVSDDEQGHGGDAIGSTAMEVEQERTTLAGPAPSEEGESSADDAMISGCVLVFPVWTNCAHLPRH